jgi:hypothetical protein
MGLHFHLDPRLDLNDDGADERAAHALHGGRADLELSRSLAHAQAACQSRADAFLHLVCDWRSPQPLALTLGPPKAGTDSFLNDRPLEFGKHAHHAEHRLAGRCAGVEALLMQEQVDAESVELGQEGDQVLKAAAQPVDRPCHHYVELPLGRISAQTIEARPLHSPLGATDAMVAVDLDDLQATALGSQN